MKTSVPKPVVIVTVRDVAFRLAGIWNLGNENWAFATAGSILWGVINKRTVGVNSHLHIQ